MTKVILEWNQKHILKEDTAQAVIGAGSGAIGMAFGEWLLHWVKELKTVIYNANTIEEVKEWYDKNIVDDDAIYWTRKNLLKTDYFSRALGMMMENHDPNWKEKLLRRCNKSIFLTRASGAIMTGLLTVKGALTNSYQ